MITEFQFAHNTLPGSLELAYLGDTVYDLYVRGYLVNAGGHVGRLHRQAVRLVCAHAQSEALGRVEGMLLPEEEAVVRRARNANQTPTKHAEAAEYHRATALEALIGWLYVTGRDARMRELLEAALPASVIEEVRREGSVQNGL